MIALLIMAAVGLVLLALIVRVALIIVRLLDPPEREPDWDISDI